MREDKNLGKLEHLGQKFFVAIHQCFLALRRYIEKHASESEGKERKTRRRDDYDDWYFAEYRPFDD